MKNSLKLMLAAGVLSLGSASKASALDVYLTGSSAFRAAVTNAIAHLLTSPVGTYDGANLAGSTHQIISGTLTTTSGNVTAGTAINVYTCWTGSLSGLSSLGGTAGVSPAFPSVYLTSAALADETEVDPGSGADSNSGVGTAGSLKAGSLTTHTTTAGHNPDGAFSDVYATSTTFNNSAFKEADGSKVLGVVPFLFVGSPDLKNYTPVAGGHVTNVSSTQAKQLYAAGLDMAQLTGNDADDAATPCNVIPVGRNADSGTRFVTFAETGFNPIGGVKQPIQYQVNFTTSGGVNTVSNVVEYPADTTFPGSVASPTPIGNSGYPSGGNEQASLNVAGTSTYTATGSQLNGYMVGTLGESDATNAVKSVGAAAANNGYFLSYNGQSYGTVTYTTSGSTVTAASVNFLGAAGRTALEEGIYTLWGYEHEYYLTTNTTNSGFLDALGAKVKTVDATIAGDKTGNMAVERTVEGGPISYVGIGNSSK